VIHADRYVNVPHVAGKFGVERMIEQMGINATILRPAYFIGNDITVKKVVTGYGVYPMPIGGKGLAMVDAYDVGETAAIELLRREQSPVPLPLERINVVGPNTLTGTDIARIWSQVLGRPIGYGGDDTRAFEQNLKQFMPSWMALDMRLMSERFLTEGMIPDAGDVERLAQLLGRPLRSYRDFAAGIAASACWRPDRLHISTIETSQRHSASRGIDDAKYPIRQQHDDPTQDIGTRGHRRHWPLDRQPSGDARVRCHRAGALSGKRKPAQGREGHRR
jgi:hypothetical protein